MFFSETPFELLICVWFCCCWYDTSTWNLELWYNSSQTNAAIINMAGLWLLMIDEDDNSDYTEDDDDDDDDDDTLWSRKLSKDLCCKIWNIFEWILGLKKNKYNDYKTFSNNNPFWQMMASLEAAEELEHWSRIPSIKVQWPTFRHFQFCFGWCSINGVVARK